MLLLASLLLFSCFSHHMTAEKVMTLMGKRMPSFALLFSMILRFVPKAGKDFREMAALHGNHPSMWQALLGITLEDAVQRSLSMKSRCYGMKTRSSYYHRKMDRTEILLCVCCVAIMAGLLVCQYMHPYRVRFFPSIHMDRLPLWMWALFFIFYGLPLIWKGKEELSWQRKDNIFAAVIRQYGSSGKGRRGAGQPCHAASLCMAESGKPDCDRPHRIRDRFWT